MILMPPENQFHFSFQIDIDMKNDPSS